jgi:hypothetical protein
MAAQEAVRIAKSNVPSVAPARTLPLPSDPTELFSAIDASIDGLSDDNIPPGTEGQLSSDGAHESFDAVSVVHLRPLRELMLESRWGTPPREWVAMCLPAVRTVRRFSEQIGHANLTPVLDGLLGTLEAIDAQGSDVAPATREALDKGYAALVERLPSLGDLGHEHDRREPVIIQALLRQVPGVHGLTLERMASAGLSGLALLLAATTDDLAAATGMSQDVASRVVQALTRYRTENQAMTASADATVELRQLRALLAELRRVHGEHEKASEAWSNEAIVAKRRLRNERAQCMRAIEVVLARLGELDRIVELERFCFGRKIDGLEAFLNHAATAR